MGFLFTPEKKEKIVAIFDIGSGSVGGAIVKMPLDGSGIPVILKTVRNEINFHKELDFDSLANKMFLALNQTASGLFNMKVSAPEEIFCVLASPWYLSETKIVKKFQDKSFTFTKHLADKLINKEILDLTQLYKEKYGSSEGTPELIEQHTMNVLLNGSSILNPLGQKCQLVEMNMVVSLAPKLFLNKVRETLLKTFHNTNIAFSTFTVSTYLAVRDRYATLDSFILLDISGELTDVGIVINGALKSVLSFPFGRKTFFKNICINLNIEMRDAEELFKLYSAGNLSDQYKNKIIPILKSIEVLWSKKFNECISTLPSTDTIPSTIFLTADNDIRNWFVNILSTYVHNEYKYTVLTLDGSDFLNMCNVNEGVCDPFLMIEAIAIMRKINK